MRKLTLDAVNGLRINGDTVKLRGACIHHDNGPMGAELFPGRVICGSETNPNQIDRNWRQVLDNSHVIGDFTWTGWDYIGEVVIGKVDYSGLVMAFNIYSSYPWLLAWTGDIDITGHRRPASYYREIVFGLREAPYIAVQQAVAPDL